MTRKLSALNRTVDGSFRPIVVSLAAMAFLTLGSVGASAQTIFGGYDCGQWTNRAKNHRMEDWLTGYLSGLSTMHVIADLQPKDPLDELNSMDQAIVWVDNFCKSNPLRKLDGAAYELFKELRAKRRK